MAKRTGMPARPTCTCGDCEECARAARDYVPAKILAEWLHREVERVGRIYPPEFARTYEHGGAVIRIARGMGVDEKMLRCWLREQDTSGRPVVYQPRQTVEEALDRYGVMYWEVFGFEDVEIRERYCRNCREHVTTGQDNICPWCDNNTREPLKALVTA